MYGDEQADAGRDCRRNPSRETEFSGANGDKEKIIFLVQLTTSRIGNLTWLILTLAICDDHTYIPPVVYVVSSIGDLCVCVCVCCVYLLNCT